MCFTESLGVDPSTQQGLKEAQPGAGAGRAAGSGELTFRDGLAPREAGISVHVFFYVKKVGRQERRTSKSRSENRKQDGLSHVGFFSALRPTRNTNSTSVEGQLLKCESLGGKIQNRLSAPQAPGGGSSPQTLGVVVLGGQRSRHRGIGPMPAAAGALPLTRVRQEVKRTEG